MEIGVACGVKLFTIHAGPWPHSEACVAHRDFARKELLNGDIDLEQAVTSAIDEAGIAKL